ncbi:AAA domain-containing protein, partial [Cyathus striatus]
VWLVAKSNVAVKNIAEKLLSVKFTSWRLIVSKDFKENWHDHLYENIQSYVITSNKLHSARSQFRNCSVILSTLDMLSNATVRKDILPIVPLNTLIVDEASQIEIGSYIPIFSDMKTLCKVCFIGDPRQYRMPPQLGQFISKVVYEDKLQSNPYHPIKNTMISCYIVDVVHGKELKTSTGSYMNDEEKMVTIQIAQHLQNSGKKYKIITPYEGQTTAIQEEMKTEGLDWGDKCFNVDSFQGNEEDYIIISLVRSQELGFLSSFCRTNVMLTRCKKGMFIVTSENFLLGAGADSLVGQLVHNIPTEGLINMADVKDGKFLKDLERNTLKVKKAQD